MTMRFGVTWDYRCPFARNAHEHLITGLRAGADWDVTWLAFSLGQVHVPEGEVPVWDDPSKDSGLLSLQTGVAVRDRDPDRFLDVHEAIFRARHDEARDVRERDIIREILTEHGADPDDILAYVDSGAALETIRKEHESAVAEHEVFGVPTYIAGDDAVFIRFMHRPDGDATVAKQTIERVMGLLLGWPELNEFKHTRRKR